LETDAANLDGCRTGVPESRDFVEGDGCEAGDDEARAAASEAAFFALALAVKFGNE